MPKLFSMHAIRRFIIPFLLCAAILPASAAESNQQPTLAGQLADVARRADDAYDRRDAATMASFFAADATATIGGLPLKGRADILGFYTKTFNNLPAGMTHRTVIRRVEPIGDMYAVDNAVYIEMPDGAQGKRVVREFFTFTLVRRVGNDWEFVAVRSTPLAPAQMAAPIKK